MRCIVLLALVVVALVGALAQPAPQEPKTLLQSNSLVAVKLTDPEKQLTTFGPLLLMVDQLLLNAPKDAPAALPKSASAALGEGIGQLKMVPGLDAKGDIWLLFMPPDPALALEAAKNAAPVPAEPAAEGAPADGAPGEEAKPAEPNPIETMPIYAVLPLQDAEKFQAFLGAQQAMGGKPLQGQVIGGRGLLVLNGPKPEFTDLQMDLTLLTKRDIAISVQTAQMRLDALGEQLPPMAMMFMMPIMSVVQEQQMNVVRVETGITMLDADLSLETFIVPVPDSPLAKSLAAPQPDGVGVACATYLPENLVYCGASGPMLQGAPGLGRTVLQVGVGMMGIFMPPDRYGPFSKAFDAVMAQCSQGRALGITPVPQGESLPGMVAVYQVKAAVDAQKTMRAFLGETVKLMGALGQNDPTAPKVVLVPNHQTLGGVPVDLFKVTMPADKANPKGKPTIVEARLAYVGDKMLVAAGGASQVQMSLILERMKAQKPGFTAGARYKSLEGVVPATARGFETFAPIDIARMAVQMNPDAVAKKAMQEKLAAFGTQKTVISTHQQICDGALQGEIRIPGEQLQLFFTIIDTIAKDAKGKTPAPEK